MDFLITICARGGSKGIPGKNIKTVNGKPLIGYSLEHALQFKEKYPSTQIYLSTDSIEIKETVADFSREVVTNYIRPQHLATDSAGKVATILDLLFYAEEKENKKYDYVLDLDVTSPLRNLDDLQKSLNIIEQNKKGLNLFSVNPAARNPYFNMVEEQENGFYSQSKKGKFLSRQVAPKVYDLNASFYFYKRRFFTEGHLTPITDHSLVYVMPHICFDLDHPIDFEFLSFLMKENKLGFKL